MPTSENSDHTKATTNPTVERKAFVLLSGGLDSTTCLMKAIFDFGTDAPEDIDEHIHDNRRAIVPADIIPITWVEAVSINYGQRHRKELEFAQYTCKSLGIKHTILNLDSILGGSMLTDPSVEIPDVSYNDLPQGVSPTYVPFRNGTLLSLITAYAQKWIDAAAKPNLREAAIYFGAHSEDAANWAYPDCTPEFIGAMANAIYIGSYQEIRLYTPLQWLKKHEIVELGAAHLTDFANTWSCYKGETLHCGVCPTCRSRREAFVIAGFPDPTIYAHPIPEAAE